MIVNAQRISSHTDRVRQCIGHLDQIPTWIEVILSQSILGLRVVICSGLVFWGYMQRCFGHLRSTKNHKCHVSTTIAAAMAFSPWTVSVTVAANNSLCILGEERVSDQHELSLWEQSKRANMLLFSSSQMKELVHPKIKFAENVLTLRSSRWVCFFIRTDLEKFSISTCSLASSVNGYRQNESSNSW